MGTGPASENPRKKDIVASECLNEVTWSMVVQHSLALVLAASSLVGGGAVVGYQMMGPGDDMPCGDMQAMHAMMGDGMMEGHDDGVAHHDEMMGHHGEHMGDMDEMHAQCHAMMEDHHGANHTRDHDGGH